MRVAELRLLNFRAYPGAQVFLRPGFNLLIGDNGAGKTSLLEALATLALARAARGGLSTELVRWGASEMGVAATTWRGEVEGRLEMRWRAQPPAGRWSRTLRAEGAPVTPAAYLGRLRVVSFWPEDLGLVKAGPEPRRRMLDVVLCQLYPQYAQALSLYRRALDQRNSSLRAIREGRADRAELRPWLEPLVQYGALVMSHRERYLKEAGPLAQRAAGRIGERTPLELRYLPGTRGASGEGWGDRLLWALRDAEEEEVARGQTVVGPQRDDFEIAYADRPARQYASQGQQRTAVLAIKAAEVSQHLAEGGQSPVVLLDDVLSELDRDHRRGLLEVLGEGMGVEQALVTATEDSGLEEAIGPSQVLLVSGGEVRGGVGS